MGVERAAPVVPARQALLTPTVAEVSHGGNCVNALVQCRCSAGRCGKSLRRHRTADEAFQASPNHPGVGVHELPGCSGCMRRQSEVPGGEARRCTRKALRPWANQHARRRPGIASHIVHDCPQRRATKAPCAVEMAAEVPRQPTTRAWVLLHCDPHSARL